MKPFNWEDSFDTGISIIDTQHQELFRRIDHLTLALYDGEGKVELKDLLSYLDSYVNEHFKTEESLMTGMQRLYFNPLLRNSGFVTSPAPPSIARRCGEISILY